MHNDDYSERLGRMISKTNDSGAQEGRQLETAEEAGYKPAAEGSS